VRVPLGVLVCSIVFALSVTTALAITRHERQGIKAAVHKLGKPKTACSRVTQAFLQYAYGADGPKGRKRCRRDARHEARVNPDVGIKRMRIIKATDERARVRVVDTDRDRAVFILLKSRRGWLLDQIV
jgi:hypothetical protein